MSNRYSSNQLPVFTLVFVLAIQLVDNRYIPYTPYYPVQPYHEGGGGYLGDGSPPLHGMMPYDHYQPVWTPHGTFFDQRRKVLRVFSGGGVPVIVDYDKRCSDGFIGVKKHPDHPQYYYACKSDCVIFGKCQDYQFFDANKGQCVPYPVPRFAPVCTKPGHYPVYSNCTLYYTCDCNLQSETFSCPQGTIFSSAQGVCIDGRQCPPTEIAQGSYIPENCEQKYPPCLENGTFRSPMDCSLYYKCAKQANGVFLQTRFKCPGDSLFDTKQELCLPQKQVACDRIQIAHMVYQSPSHKSYPPNYYPYVADSGEINDFSVSQPRRINCPNKPSVSPSGEDLGEPNSNDPMPSSLKINPAAVILTTTATPQTQQNKITTSTTSIQPELTATTVQAASESTTNTPRVSRASDTTNSDTSLSPLTTEVTGTTILLTPDTSTASSSPSTIPDVSSPAAFGSTSTTDASTARSSPSTIADVSSRATLGSSTALTTDANMATSSPSTITDISSTVTVGSSTTLINTSERISTTNSMSTTEVTARPVISTTERISTTNSFSTTKDDTTSQNTSGNTTEQKIMITTEITTLQTENSQGTSIFSTQTDTTDVENEIDLANTEIKQIQSDSLSTITPAPTTTVSPLDTKVRTLHSFNTNTIESTITTPAPKSEVLRDSRSIDSIAKEQQILSSTTPPIISRTILDDSDTCCSQERMVLDDEIVLDHSGSPEDYESSEEFDRKENVINATTMSPSTINSVENRLDKDTDTNDFTNIQNTPQKNVILQTQSTTQRINSAGEEIINNQSNDETVINTTPLSKVLVKRIASSTEANNINTDATKSDLTKTVESTEDYDSQEYIDSDDDTTTSRTLESSTATPLLIQSSTVAGITETSNVISEQRMIERKVLDDEIVLVSTTPIPTTENTSKDVPPKQNASIEEFDSEEYMDEDETTEDNQDNHNEIKSSNTIETTNVTDTTSQTFKGKNDNIMVLTKNTTPVLKDEIDLNSEILANVKEIKTISSNTPTTELPSMNEIPEDMEERQVLSDEIIIATTTVASSNVEATTISSTTPAPQLHIQMTTSASVHVPNTTSEASFEYESEEEDNLEESSERKILSDEIIIATTSTPSPNTTQMQIASTLPSTDINIVPTTESSSSLKVERDINEDAYDDFEETDNYDEMVSDHSDNVLVTSTSSPPTQSTTSNSIVVVSEHTENTLLNAQFKSQTLQTSTQTPIDMQEEENDDTQERLVLSDEVIIATPRQTQNTSSITQMRTNNTFSDIRLINLHMRESQNMSTTNFKKPVNNTSIIIGEGTCIENPNVPTLNLTVYGDINLHIRFCPRPCNKTHQHNYEKKPIIDAVWDSNSSNKTMNLQAN